MIGDYTECTFRTRGTGTFRGGDETNPYLGERGRLEKVEEVRIETVVPAHAAGRAAEAATAAHPYEEMALDVYPVEGSPRGLRLREARDPAGAGYRRGVDASTSRSSLGFPARLVADAGRRIESVAVLGGSGGSFIPEAAASGAHAYVTGDVDYHDALLAESLGLTVIDADTPPRNCPRSRRSPCGSRNWWTCPSRSAGCDDKAVQRVSWAVRDRPYRATRFGLRCGSMNRSSSSFVGRARMAP